MVSRRKGGGARGRVGLAHGGLWRPSTRLLVYPKPRGRHACQRHGGHELHAVCIQGDQHGRGINRKGAARLRRPRFRRCRRRGGRNTGNHGRWRTSRLRLCPLSPRKRGQQPLPYGRHLRHGFNHENRQPIAVWCPHCCRGRGHARRRERRAGPGAGSPYFVGVRCQQLDARQPRAAHATR